MAVLYLVLNDITIKSSGQTYRVENLPKRNDQTYKIRWASKTASTSKEIDTME